MRRRDCFSRMLTATIVAPVLLITLIAASVMVLLATPLASAATPSPGWTIRSSAEPTNFSSSDDVSCEREVNGCDLYRVIAQNVGNAPSSGTVTISDELPEGLLIKASEGIEGEEQQAGSRRSPMTCTAGPRPEPLKCTYESEVPPGGVLIVTVLVSVEPGAPPTVENKAKIEGGVTGTTPSASTSQPGSQTNTINGGLPLFAFTSFAFNLAGIDGAPDLQAGDHPYGLTVGFNLANAIQTNVNFGRPYSEHIPIQDGVKNLTVALPAGMVGDPQATPRCPLDRLIAGGGGSGETGCPAASVVGSISFELTHSVATSDVTGFSTSAAYNMEPEAGYPAEFGFVYFGKPAFIYAGATPAPAAAGGYGLRAVIPGLVDVELKGASVTFFGDPAEHDGDATSPQAFLTNPVNCADPGPLEGRIEGDSWEDPGRYVSSETEVYPRMTGCDALQFNPLIAFAPEVATRADEPAAYGFGLHVPQAINVAPVPATPELKDATVTLPAGVSVSPSAADGLVGCQETGSEGIDIPHGEGRADEVGEGQALGPEGLSHLTPGHCPAGSKLGTVEVETPLLPPHTLTGSVYLAQPKCGGEGQPACTEADAEEGRMFGLYLEVQGAGVILKLAGEVEAGGYGLHSRAVGLQPGQLRATFKNNPQLPFSDLQLHLTGGPRAPLANPQSCGTFTTTSALTPWSAPETPDGTPSSRFEVGGCAGSPFAPSFSAGTVTPSAGAFSPFTLTFSRKDGEQDLSGLTVTTPPGLLGVLKSVVQCPEPEAQKGECGEGSLIGHDEVAAGAGSHPFWEAGSVYLTGPYGGAPFGLSIVTPAQAGPFNLGNVIVRAAIHVNPNTSALTVTSEPLPQIIDGVPLRIQTVNVTIDRPGFMFNPTNCDQQAVTGTITSAQGASVGVSSPFAVTGCASLPFKPSFTALTQAKTSRADGASLVVKVSQKPGEANIHKVDLQLPLALPTRLTTLHGACTEAQFNTNPAGCPAASVIGTATAVTPVLSAPLTGPAYLVSHGGAAFPDVEFILQGQGVTIVLDGKTDIKKGITYSKFETVPDAPISSFETSLPEGPHSVLAANGKLCGQSLAMPTTIVGQNGRQVTQSTNIAVTGCAQQISITKKKLAGRSVSVTVKTTVKGVVTITGAGLRKTSKTFAAGSHTIKVSLTATGRSARKHRHKIKIKAALKVGKKTVSKTASLKL